MSHGKRHAGFYLSTQLISEIERKNCRTLASTETECLWYRHFFVTIAKAICISGTEPLDLAWDTLMVGTSKEKFKIII